MNQRRAAPVTNRAAVERLSAAAEAGHMATGWTTQTAKLAGEYLVAGELCRRGFLATTFSGNVRDFDVLAVSEDRRFVTVQVKTIRGGDFQIGDARKFVEITVRRRNGEAVGQEVGDLTTLDDSPWVFVYLAAGESPQYFIVPVLEVQRLVVVGYRENLARHDGRKPVNSESFHHALKLKELEPFRDAWGLLLGR